MKKIKVRINQFEEVGRFVNIIDRMIGDVDLKCGCYIVDARSVVGVATLAGGRVLELCIHQQQDLVIEQQLLPFTCNAE